jgi:plastocyanin
MPRFLLTMRRLSALAFLVLAVGTVAACSSGETAGWTYAPAPSATPVPSGSAAASPSVEPSGAASPSAPVASGSAAPTGSAEPSGGAVTVTITAPVGASTSGFDPTKVEVPADTPFTLIFDNQDNQAPHNLVITNVTVEGDTQFFTGPGTREYKVPALAAGDYPFLCQVHPTTMTGTITAK